MQESKAVHTCVVAYLGCASRRHHGYWDLEIALKNARGTISDITDSKYIYTIILQIKHSMYMATMVTGNIIPHSSVVEPFTAGQCMACITLLCYIAHHVKDTKTHDYKQPNCMWTIPHWDKTSGNQSAHMHAWSHCTLTDMEASSDAVSSSHLLVMECSGSSNTQPMSS